ncbi:MAG: hypothetical protein LBB61_05340 [Treponema sp.]|nr:hypothetical protein [Treponema sp.]
MVYRVDMERVCGRIIGGVSGEYGSGIRADHRRCIGRIWGGYADGYGADFPR